MVEATLLQGISSVGFPIAMSVYLVVKFEKTISTNTDAIKNLSAIIKTWRRK